MTYNEIKNFIDSLGFPIVCCVVMFIQNGKLQKTLSELSLTLEKMRLELGKEHTNNE